MARSMMTTNPHLSWTCPSSRRQMAKVLKQTEPSRIGVYRQVGRCLVSEVLQAVPVFLVALLVLNQDRQVWLPAS